MTVLAKNVKKNALKLSPKERASIAHELIVSLDESFDDTLNLEWEAEIKRRVQMIKKGKVKGQPASEVFAEIEAKYK